MENQRETKRRPVENHRDNHRKTTRYNRRPMQNHRKAYEKPFGKPKKNNRQTKGQPWENSNKWQETQWKPIGQPWEKHRRRQGKPEGKPQGLEQSWLKERSVIMKSSAILVAHYYSVKWRVFLLFLKQSIKNASTLNQPREEVLASTTDYLYSK